jgi:leucyl aminopeptidase
MIRTARVAAPAEGLARPTVAVTVVVDDGQALVAASVPDVVAGQALPRVLGAEWCARQGLRAEAGSAVALRSIDGTTLVLVSVGPTLNDAECYRLAGAAAARAAGEGSVAILLPTDGLDDPGTVAQALVEGAVLATYRFRADADAEIDVVPLGTPLPAVEVHDDVAEGVARGAVVAEGVAWARRLIDTPPGEMTPRRLAKAAASRLGKDPHVTVEVWTRPRIEEERLGALLGVAAGSNEPPRLVYATYDPSPGEELPHVALVGKGVTFDSGGLSLKPADAMTSMKTDMSGAAIVLAAASIASRLGLEVRVTVIAPLTENLPSGTATKPGDVLRARNGVTMEVLNTDAEGRLILADALCLAVEANPDAIVDVATLTGAQRIALGDEIGALFATTDELADSLLAASERSGEDLWRLPLARRYRSHIDSDLADVKNTGKPGTAGTISAALFLERFTDGRPWAHLDIAGPGRATEAKGYVTKGATAFATRTLVEFLADAAG